MTSKQQLRRWSLGSASGGMVGWLLYLLLDWERGWNYVTTIERLLLLAVLIYTPLALALVYQWAKADLPERTFQVACYLQPVAALGVVAAFMQPAGSMAALLSLPWLGCTALIALAGLRQRWLAKGQHPVPEVVLTMGMLYLPVGASWLVLSRLGARPLAFPDVIVLLTAVHFHYTGFAVPVITAMTGRFFAHTHRMIPAYPWVAGLIVSAMPLIAAGITFSPWLEALGVLILFGAIVGLAALTGFSAAPQLLSPLARWLLTIAACAMVTAITPAFLYGAGELLGRSFITIPRMVQIHGFTNAFGFITCGLIGWLVAGTGLTDQPSQHAQ